MPLPRESELPQQTVRPPAWRAQAPNWPMPMPTTAPPIRTTAVGAELALEEPVALPAVSLTRSAKAASSAPSAY